MEIQSLIYLSNPADLFPKSKLKIDLGKHGFLKNKSDIPFSILGDNDIKLKNFNKFAHGECSSLLSQIKTSLDDGKKFLDRFIIEILSDSNLKTDLKDKYALYQENGVGEYWIVFPNEKMIQKFLLVDNIYQIAGIYMENEMISPTLCPDLEIDLKKVFEEI